MLHHLACDLIRSAYCANDLLSLGSIWGHSVDVHVGHLFFEFLFDICPLGSILVFADKTANYTC